MASKTSHTTTNHDEIRRWIEERNGKPATVRGTASRGDNAGMLRVDFPGYSGDDSLEEISWDDFFAKFDESNLALGRRRRWQGKPLLQVRRGRQGRPPQEL